MRFTGLPRAVVEPIRQRMISPEIWTVTDANCDHWYFADGVFAVRYFWLDVLVGNGLVTRKWDNDEGAYGYTYPEKAIGHTTVN
ncbi:MAG TPA: hypothetical protein VJP02_24990 [Candidatus Sulfotelmatobacter sp.]|nr:hypothetical protein [Candidatus Sulfotelmatobacter sp.]